MAPARFTVVLKERLGQESYEALEELIQVRQANLLTVDRFEQRLGEELGKVRLELTALRSGMQGEMTALRSDMRGEMGALRSDMRGEMGALRSELKGDMGALRTELHGDMYKLGADIRVDIAQRSAELMKWAMVFWVAQAAAVAGLITAFR